MASAPPANPAPDFNLAPLLDNLHALREALSNQIAVLPEEGELRAELECIRLDSIEPALNALYRLAGCHGADTFN